MLYLKNEERSDIMSQRAFKTEKLFDKKFKEYIEYCHKELRLPNVAGFSVYADINRDTFYQYKDIYPDTFKKINNILEDEALNNKCLNDARIIFYMKNKCGYADKQEVDARVQNEGILADLVGAINNAKNSK